MDVKRVENIFALLDETDISEICWEKDGLKLRLKRTDVQQKKQSIKSKPTESVQPQNIETPIVENKLAEPKVFFSSKMLGLFHVIDKKTGKPFVSEGDAIKAGQKIGQVESMKIFKDIIAKEDFIIEKILVENNKPIQYGQNIFAIKKI